ncbi:MAG: FAD-dependent monooxygenase [Pseudomonadota bacterium]
MTNAIDVLVVGAGPTGSVLAIDLARRGLKVRIIEKNAHSFPGSRAKGLQPRTLELLHDLGAIDAILEAGGLYPLMGVHQGDEIVPRLMYNNIDQSDDAPFPNTCLIAQYQTDAILHRRLTELGIDVEFNTELIAFEQDANTVTATLRKAGSTETVLCKYMVGADGGASTVRETLGVPFPGKTDESDRMIIVDSLVDGLSREYWHAWMSENNRFTVACPLPGGDVFQWMIQLQEGEEPDLSEAALNERIQRNTKPSELRIHDISWTTVFRPNIRLAEDYRIGRILLAGDAAHVHTPMGAQGLNTGVQDAYNLGWKLHQVISGAPNALLDTYEAERQPLAAAVLEMSTKKYEAAARSDPETLERGKDEQQLLITYRAGPLGRGNRPGTSRLQIGDRAPDAKLEDHEGQPTSLFELLKGPQFSIIGYGEKAARKVALLKWPKRGAQLKRIVVAKQVPDIIGLVACSDANGSLRTIYGLKENTICLIRPDGYIGLIAEADSLETLRADLAPFLPQTEPVDA